MFSDICICSPAPSDKDMKKTGKLCVPVMLDMVEFLTRPQVVTNIMRMYWSFCSNNSARERKPSSAHIKCNAAVPGLKQASSV